MHESGLLNCRGLSSFNGEEGEMASARRVAVPLARHEITRRCAATLPHDDCLAR